MLSHLHGDHFGGIPFFLLDGQFLARREKPLLIAGPPGTSARLDAALEVFFPKSTGSKWRFRWRVEEIPVGVQSDVLGHSLITAEVIHQSGAPSTALRLLDGERTFAYSGDTEWTDALLPAASSRSVHLRMLRLWRQAHRAHELGNPANRKFPVCGAPVMLTHMNPSMLARLDEISRRRRAGRRMACSLRLAIEQGDQTRRIPALAAHGLDFRIELVDQRAGREMRAVVARLAKANS